MILIKKYDAEQDLLTVKCDCGEVFYSDLSQEKVEFQEEFNQYSNITLQCPECSIYHILNMNIPCDEYSEISIEEVQMDFSDIDNRKNLRDVIWAKRADLKDLSRNEFNQNHLHHVTDWVLEKVETVEELAKELS